MVIETSWDDGHKLDLKVAELLKKYNLPGTFYIVLDNIGKEDYLTWDDIKKISEMGFEIGSHTMTHQLDLKLLFDDELKYELQTSKEMLETALGKPVTKLCYPRGRYDDRVLKMAEHAGYTYGRTTKVLSVDNPEEGNLEVPTTIHVYQRKEYDGVPWEAVALDCMASAIAQEGTFHLWGHSWEIDRDNNWKKLEAMFKTIQEMIKRQ